MQSSAPSFDPRITYSRLVVERDDGALAAAHRVVRFPLGERNPWRKEFADLTSDMARSPLVEAVAYFGGDLFVMAAASADARGLTLGGKVPEAAPWPGVCDCVLVRLLLNSCARVDGLTDPVNETGHFYRVVKREKNALRAFEAVVGEDLAFTVAVRSFTKKSYLKKVNGGRLPDEYLGRAAYKVNEAGAIVYSRDDDDDDYVVKSPKRFDSNFFEDVRGDGAAEKISLTKLGFLNDLVRALNSRYGSFLKVGYAEMERVRLLEIRGSEQMRADVLSPMVGERINVSYSSPAARDAARELARSAGSGRATKSIGSGMLNVRVVPDEVSMDDGYAVFEGEVVQHVTASLSAKLAGEVGEGGRPGTLMEGVLKELAVKRDVASGRITAFDWSRFGFGEFKCAKAVYVRLKGRRRQAGDEKGEGQEQQSKKVKKVVRGEVEDRYQLFVGFLSIAADGSMDFSLGDTIDAQDEDWSEPLVGEDGDPVLGKVACHMELGGEACDFVISDTELITIPNDLGEMISDQVERGMLARKVTGTHGFHDRLAPLYGIGAAWEDGALWYYVGHSKRMNMVLKRASRLRRVDGLDAGMVDAFLGTLDVGLARLGQPSVYPIPVKYLNEYAALKFGYEGEQQSLF